MKVLYSNEDKQLTVKITEEVDHYSTEKLRTRIDFEIQNYIPAKLVLDFEKVSFMDSAGIGLILGRYKMIKMFGGTMEIINVSIRVKKVLEMAGITKIIKIVEDIGGEGIGKCI